MKKSGSKCLQGFNYELLWKVQKKTLQSLVQRFFVGDISGWIRFLPSDPGRKGHSFNSTRGGFDDIFQVLGLYPVRKKHALSVECRRWDQLFLVGGFNPFEKYQSKWDHFPKDRG